MVIEKLEWYEDILQGDGMDWDKDYERKLTEEQKELWKLFSELGFLDRKKKEDRGKDDRLLRKVKEYHNDDVDLLFISSLFGTSLSYEATRCGYEHTASWHESIGCHSVS